MKIPARMLPLILAMLTATVAMAQQPAATQRPKGPCDIYASAGAPCAAAHSTTRALYAAYNGPLYQVLRQSDNKTLDIQVAPGGYANAPEQDKFCAGTYCWISIIYDQSPNHNHLTQAPRGGFSGPALGGFNNLPIADLAPLTIMGHKVYGVFIEPGMGLRQNDVKGTAVDDQAEGQYWVVNGKHYNAACCFDYGNAEIDSRDDDNGTMETLYFGNATPWFSGSGNGPWIMTDQENNLVGCVNEDGTKGCPHLPSIPFRFVTAIGKGEPHHWASLGGDAQKGALTIMFDGKRVDATYDPMRKQGAILLGNGGDNSDGSQGTLYEGAATAAGTFPSNATDQLVQANIVAAGYEVAPLTVGSVQQTFSPGSAQDVTVTFTNTTGAPATGVAISLALPGKQWTSAATGTTETKLAPGAVVSASFKVTSGPVPINGDIVANATWSNVTTGSKQTETAVLKVRNARPVKINEFRVNSAAPGNPTNSFIELYNAGAQSIDISNWTLTTHPARQAIFSAIKIPAGTKLAAKSFYLLGLSNSGLAAPAHSGDTVLHVRNTDGMAVGATVTIATGSNMETRTIAALGTAATSHTPLWQSLPELPVLTIPAGSTNVPVESTSGFVAGQKIALGHGSTFPDATNPIEQYEIATVTEVGKPGTQAYLAMKAPAGATNLKVTSLSDISIGDTIRLDVASVDHGIETVTVAKVGTAAGRTNLASPVEAGAKQITIRRAEGFAVGDKIEVGTPATQEEVTVTTLGSQGPDGTTLDVTPALAKAHVASEWVVSPGTGLDLAAPLRFNHAANLPFSDRGTGISFQPATAFAHTSNEPVQALGTGITLDRPLDHDHAIHEVIRDAAVKTAGYQGTPQPNQYFGGPEFTTHSLQFGQGMTVEEGSLVLRDAAGVVTDSLNYGNLVDPWAAEGDQSVSGAPLSGCYAPAPGSIFEPWSTVVAHVAVNASAGRYPDGTDTDSNCNDFLTQAVATLSAGSSAGGTNLKVTSVQGFRPGQKILIDSAASLETAVIATVGTAGAATLKSATDAGATVLHTTNATGFRKGQTITVGDGADSETAIVSAARARGGATITLAAALARAHATGAQISGTGLTLTTPLTRTHDSGAQISDNVPTPGAPNQYQAAKQ
jgi:non-reducing end alpha-L-arabinofuranosidase